ncbi:hypothetical protein BJV74DRAFT_843312 [Russula compacta]|nr:hypothetical protein BJV74DRAFT_843312 [Russula compacta]
MSLWLCSQQKYGRSFHRLMELVVEMANREDKCVQLNRVERQLAHDDLTTTVACSRWGQGVGKRRNIVHWI